MTEAALADTSAVLPAIEVGFIETFMERRPRSILETLLADRTTGKNIIWADSEYEDLGVGYAGDDEITVERISGGRSGLIKPRVAKELERRSLRTKSRAEVFTPSWLVNRMNNLLDDDWFGRAGVFNRETDGGWEAMAGCVEFPKTRGRGWHAYVESTRLEITCGEAPFICSRYDTVTGAEIPVPERIGMLDRKLRVVSERCGTRQTWSKWALVALQSTYGYEYQGDNLLIARINVFETFMEHLRERWGEGPTIEEMERAAWVVSWNLWQMDGLTCAPPTNVEGAVAQSTLPGFEMPSPEPVQMSLFDGVDGLWDDEPACEKPQNEVPFCIIYDWEEDEPFEFAALGRLVR